MYVPAAPILKSLARETETFRTRDAREGEETIWDTIMRGKSHFIDMDRQAMSDDQYEDIFYSEADVLEDLVLFPDENSGENALFKPGKSAVEKLVGNVASLKRFICDLDTDEDTDSSDAEEVNNHLEAHRTGGGESHDLALRRRTKSPALDNGHTQKMEELSHSEEKGRQISGGCSSAEDDSSSRTLILAAFSNEQTQKLSEIWLS